MVKNCIFDFGNVIAEFYPDKLTKPFVEDEVERKIISDIVFDRLYWDKLDEGTISGCEVKTEIRKRVEEKWRDIACDVFDKWIYNLTPVDGVKEIIKDIKNNGKKIYLLSNISKEFADNYRKIEWIYNIFSEFDGLVFSGPINIVKPDIKIFEYLLKNYDLKPEECLFIDDSMKNIDGAKKAGIDGFLFQNDAEELRRYLILSGII